MEKFKELLFKKFKHVNALEYSRGKYYTSQFCIIPFSDDDSFGVKLIPVKNSTQDKVTYQIYRDTIYKKPTKTEIRSTQDLFDDILSKMNDMTKCLMSDNYKNYTQFIKQSV